MGRLTIRADLLTNRRLRAGTGKDLIMIAYGLLGLAIAGVVWNTVTSMLIYADLHHRGMKVSFVLLRLMIPFYAHQYRKITTRETGKPGPLFYHWIISINTALVTGIAGIVALRA
jgi:hypothetical protein